MIARRATVSLTMTAFLALALPACAPAAPEAPLGSGTPAASASPSPTPEPTPEAVKPTCENTSTAQWQQMMAENGWVSWTGRVAGVEWSPFEGFPEDPSDAGIVCTWGEDPELATDNILTLAWAPIGAAAAASAQEQLVAEGYERITAAEGTYLARRSEGGSGDAEGFAETYLFTDGDVRWGQYKDQVVFVSAPDDPR